MVTGTQLLKLSWESGLVSGPAVRPISVPAATLPPLLLYPAEILAVMTPSMSTAEKLGSGTHDQGLTLVHFAAQSEPFRGALPLKPTSSSHRKCTR